MYSGLVHAHSGLRWVALVLLVVAFINAISRWQKRSNYTAGDHKLNLYTLISVHTQLILGIILLFISPKVNFSMMSDKLYRFYSVEHTTGMLIAIILITIGYSRAKRTELPTNKHRLVSVFFGLGLLLILLSIPWPFRIPGAGWF